MKPKALLTGFVLATIGLSPLVGAQEHEHHHATMDKAGSFAIPASLREEHEELHAQLGQLTKLPGKTGEAARAVADALHPHFAKEEEYALPALGLLPALGRGEVTSEIAAAFARELRHHALTEEEILYPAAIVVGEYVRLRLGN